MPQCSSSLPYSVQLTPTLLNSIHRYFTQFNWRCCLTTPCYSKISNFLRSRSEAGVLAMTVRYGESVVWWWSLSRLDKSRKLKSKSSRSLSSSPQFGSHGLQFSRYSNPTGWYVIPLWVCERGTIIVERAESWLCERLTKRAVVL